MECWELVSRLHQVSHCHGELFAKRSSGIVEREVCKGNPLAPHPHRGQGIANRDGHGGAGGGCKVEWEDFSVDASYLHHIAATGQ